MQSETLGFYALGTSEVGFFYKLIIGAMSWDFVLEIVQ